MNNTLWNTLWQTCKPTQASLLPRTWTFLRWFWFGQPKTNTHFLTFNILWQKGRSSTEAKVLNFDCEQLVALKHHQAATGNFQDGSSLGFRREVKSWQTSGWSYFNWGGKGKMHISNTSELMSWKMQFKPAANKASPGKPQQCLKEMSSKGKAKHSPVTLHWHSLSLSPPGTAFQSISAKPPIQHHLQSPAPPEKKPNAPSQDNWGFPGSMRTQKLRP